MPKYLATSRKEARELAKKYRITYTRAYAIATINRLFQAINYEITKMKRHRDGTMFITFRPISPGRIPLRL